MFCRFDKRCIRSGLTEQGHCTPWLPTISCTIRIELTWSCERAGGQRVLMTVTREARRAGA